MGNRAKRVFRRIVPALALIAGLAATSAPAEELKWGRPDFYIVEITKLEHAGRLSEEGRKNDDAKVQFGVSVNCPSGKAIMDWVPFAESSGQFIRLRWSDALTRETTNLPRFIVPNDKQSGEMSCTSIVIDIVGQHVSGSDATISLEHVNRGEVINVPSLRGKNNWDGRVYVDARVKPGYLRKKPHEGKGDGNDLYQMARANAVLDEAEFIAAFQPMNLSVRDCLKRRKTFFLDLQMSGRSLFLNPLSSKGKGIELKWGFYDFGEAFIELPFENILVKDISWSEKPQGMADFSLGVGLKDAPKFPLTLTLGKRATVGDALAYSGDIVFGEPMQLFGSSGDILPTTPLLCDAGSDALMTVIDDFTFALTFQILPLMVRSN